MVPYAAPLPVAALEAGIVRCRHCGDRCRGESAVFVADGAFCCHGCESVFTLLHREGLEEFYACDVTPGVSQRAPRPGSAMSLELLDNPEVQSRFVESRDGELTRAIFTVPGMHCGSCLWLLERLWRLDPGIVRSDVDLVRRTVRVTFRADRVSLRRIAESLSAVGYAPALDADRDAPSMPLARRTLYLKIAVAGFAFGNAMLFSVPRYLNGTALDETYRALFGGLNLFLAAGTLLFSASGYFTAAARALRHRAITLDVPVALGLAALFGRTVVDITLGRGEGFADSFTGLVFFLLIGRLFQQHAFDRIAFDRSFRSFLPLAVHVEQPAGETIVPIERLRPGDIFVICDVVIVG